MPQLSLLTPVGELTLSEEDGAIVALDWGRGRDQTTTPLLGRAREMLDAYFDGERLAFDTLPLTPAGTVFQQSVWAALRGIQFGEKRSYAEIARKLDTAPRAVGMACGANPIPILIPCHRVVATGGLGGYSGADGPATKRALLALEARALELGSFQAAAESASRARW
jgi:methylated-DNA-[protein]-cysteine S-methyltransferase